MSLLEQTWQQLVLENLDKYAVILLDPRRKVLACNPGVHSVMGYKKGSLVGRSADVIFTEEDKAIDRPQYEASVATANGFSDDTRWHLKADGSRIWVSGIMSALRSEEGKLLGFAKIMRDDTPRKRAEDALKAHDEQLQLLNQQLAVQVEQLEAAEASLKQVNDQLYQNAFHDSLTNLPNRRLFLERLEHILEQQKRHPERTSAVLFLDFDRFKVVNDSLGHEVGDALLIAVGRRLLTCIRPADTVARLGGDEFAILLEEVQPHRNANRVARRIAEVFRQPLSAKGNDLYTSASIGIVASTNVYASAENIMRDADTAMYRAKAAGGATHQVFGKEMHQQAIKALELERELREAVGTGAFKVVYHPLMCDQGKRLLGFEALARWQHPRRGLLLPEDFLPLAEETGLIVDIDRFVWREACSQLTNWQAQFDQDLCLNLNFSSQQFRHPDLSKVISAISDETGFDLNRLNVEVTERTFLEASQEVIGVLNKLKALGVQLFLDDFGMGYSSLSYLQQFPVDALKIDRSFVSNMIQSDQSMELVRTIISMARNLNLETVAEGVETQLQLDRLLALGCSQTQGYLHARPLLEEQVEPFIAALQAI